MGLAKLIHSFFGHVATNFCAEGQRLSPIRFGRAHSSLLKLLKHTPGFSTPRCGPASGFQYAVKAFARGVEKNTNSSLSLSLMTIRPTEVASVSELVRHYFPNSKLGTL